MTDNINCNLILYYVIHSVVVSILFLLIIKLIIIIIKYARKLLYSFIRLAFHACCGIIMLSVQRRA